VKRTTLNLFKWCVCDLIASAKAHLHSGHGSRCIALAYFASSLFVAFGRLSLTHSQLVRLLFNVWAQSEHFYLEQERAEAAVDILEKAELSAVRKVRLFGLYLLRLC
jgi:hypothetical protein